MSKDFDKSSDFDKSGSTLGNSGEGTLAERASQRQEDDLRNKLHKQISQKDEILGHFGNEFHKFLENGISLALKGHRDNFSFVVNIPWHYQTNSSINSTQYHFKNASKIIQHSTSISADEIEDLVQNIVMKEFEISPRSPDKYFSISPKQSEGGMNLERKVWPVIKKSGDVYFRGMGGYFDGSWHQTNSRHRTNSKEHHPSIRDFGIFSFSNDFNSAQLTTTPDLAPHPSRPHHPPQKSPLLCELDTLLGHQISSSECNAYWEWKQLDEEDFELIFAKFIQLPKSIAEGAPDYDGVGIPRSEGEWFTAYAAVGPHSAPETPHRGNIFLNADGKARVFGGMMHFIVGW